MTKKSISIKSRNICKDSLGSLTSNIGTYTDRNEYVQKKKKSFMKKIDMSQKSQIQDSSRSYNQCTKEDTNSSCNITENSNSWEKQNHFIERSSSCLAYYGTPKQHKMKNAVFLSPPKGLFQKSIGNIQTDTKSTGFKNLIEEFKARLQKVQLETITQDSLAKGNSRYIKIASKSSVAKDEFLSVLIHQWEVAFSKITQIYNQILKISQDKTQTLEVENKQMSQKLIKLNEQIKEMVDEKKNLIQVHTKQESSVFNYKETKNTSNLPYQVEESSSSLFSIPKEDSFDNTFESLELKSQTNESSGDSISVAGEEPQVINICQYNMKRERWFDIMKKEPYQSSQHQSNEQQFWNVNERSRKHDANSNLQSNMKKFEQYHLGRNNWMKMTKNASILKL